ncbi:MAG: UDP-galactopyranose mutase [Thermosphaera sp.]
MTDYDYLIVGSGFFGSVVAEQLKKQKRILVLEKREHIGGNCYSYYYEDTNICVHKYGTHIFHTNSKEVWDYINRFSDFNRYQHQVLTTYHGKVYFMPINLSTINSFYEKNLKPEEVDSFLEKKKGNIQQPKNLEEKAISLIGRDLYEAFIKGYTTKQWGCDPKELPPATITRLPVRNNYFISYFDDIYQGLPIDGYTPIFQKMLENVPLELGVDFLGDREYWLKKAKNVIYTGPIDRYFDYCYGKLRWRSLRFEIEKLEIDDYQGTSVMNYADLEVPYTRIHEPKHLHRERKQKKGVTVIIREFPCDNDEEPYYPVNSEKDKELLLRYQNLQKKEKNVIFGGRLAEYKYYDMHQVIAAALKVSRSLLN